MENPEFEREHLLGQIQLLLPQEWETRFSDYFWFKAKDARNHSANIKCQQWMMLYKHVRKISDDLADLYFAWSELETE